MGSFIKNLKSLFVIEEDTKESKDAVKSPEAKPVLADALTDSVELKEGQETGAVNQKFLEILLKSMEESNQTGFDYLEYKQSLKSLRKMNLDEATRFQSAFAMAQTMGATPDSLRQTGELYLQILKKEEEKFRQSLVHQRKIKVDEKKVTLANVDKWIAAKEAEIQKIQEQIEKKQASKSKIEEDILLADKKIQKVQNNFMATYMHLVDQIKEDLEKIKRYLK